MRRQSRAVSFACQPRALVHSRVELIFYAHHGRRADHSLLPRKIGTDALSFGVTPRTQATLVKVLIRMRTSTASDTLSTYHTSYSNFCSHVRALRPLTCAQPVMPGSTSWRRDCRREYRSRYSTSNGLGPTRLI